MTAILQPRKRQIPIDDEEDLSVDGNGFDFTKDDQQGMLASSDVNQTKQLYMPELEVEAEKPFDYLYEKKLLKQYGDRLKNQDTRDQDYADTSRSIINSLRSSMLKDKEISDMEKRKSDVTTLAGYASLLPTTMHLYGGSESIGVPQSSIQQNLLNQIKSIESPIRESEIKKSQLKDELSAQNAMANIDRQVIQSRGQDLKSYSDVNKRLFDISETQENNDPLSQRSVDAQSAMKDAIAARLKELKTPSSAGGEKRERYRNLSSFYESMYGALESPKSINQLKRLNDQISAVDAATSKKVDQDIKEQGYEISAKKLDAYLGAQGKDFRKDVVKAGAEVLSKQDALNTVLELAELARDPEIRTGFGTMIANKVLEVSREGLTPKQARFQMLLGRATTPEIHQLFGASFTKGEEGRATSFMPTEDQSIQSIIEKADGMRNAAAHGLYNQVSGHYYLVKNRSFNKDFGFGSKDFDTPYSESQINQLRSYDPYSAPSTSNATSKSKISESEYKKTKKDSADKKTYTMKQISDIAKATGQSIEETIKDAIENGYSVR